MSTFYDPATIRRLAATGDAFYRGAAWILDQQDAANLQAQEELMASMILSARMVARVAQRSEFRSVEETRARLNARRGNWDDDWSPTPAA